jgi:hypothetical protein
MAGEHVSQSVRLIGRTAGGVDVPFKCGSDGRLVITGDIADLDILDGIRMGIDGGGFTLTTGVKSPFIIIPFACTIQGWSLRAEVSSSITIDVLYHATLGSVPASICAAALPALSSAISATSTTLTGWTTTLARGGVMTLQITSAPAAATWATFILNVERT